MTIHWKPVEQYFTVKLFVFQFYPVCNFRNIINFGLGTVSSESGNVEILKPFRKQNYCYHLPKLWGLNVKVLPVELIISEWENLAHLDLHHQPKGKPGPLGSSSLAYGSYALVFTAQVWSAWVMAWSVLRRQGPITYCTGGENKVIW